jgi:hypothetical protein
MRVVQASPVQYELLLNDQSLALNPLLGKSINLAYTGRISCIHCGRATKKSFSQGYCYPCFMALAQCDLCILRPETCHYHEGTCREPDWAESHCLTPHIVYLANSSGIKVGITRQNQIPTRWIDQGAVQALPIFKVSSRHVSGLIEVIVAKHISDKTSWQQMLKNNVEHIDLSVKRDELMSMCEPELTKLSQQFGAEAINFLPSAQSIDILYPVTRFPDKVKSFNLDANPEVSGTLEGIKGQYLLLDTGVINVRKFSGYEIEFSLDQSKQTDRLAATSD